MITNFEEVTCELSEYELRLVPVLIRGFETKTKANPIKAPEIIKSMKGFGYKISEPRLRKICNHIRSNGLLPLIATSNGYYVSYDRDEIAAQIRSLRERADSINNCANGLTTFINGTI